MHSQNKKLNSILKIMEKLPEGQIAPIIDALYAQLSVCEKQTDNSVYVFQTEKIESCRHCGSVHIVKNGKDRHGHTRYLCRDCCRTFGDMTNTVVSGTHKDASTWKEYIRALLDGRTLEMCASRCHISVPTAFVWRHKIMNALSQNIFDHTFDGLVEMDETWVRISYKGNHSKNKDFVIPRTPHKRGTDSSSKSKSTHACILCAVERNRTYSGIIPCRGTPNLQILNLCLSDKFSDDCIVMTDGLRTYGAFFKNTGVEHIALPPSGCTRKPAVKGVYHLNNVNALHSRLGTFLRKYNGVSTKYLSNYLGFFLWLENNKNAHRENLLHHKISWMGSYISAIQLHQFAPAPDMPPAA